MHEALVSEQGGREERREGRKLGRQEMAKKVLQVEKN